MSGLGGGRFKMNFSGVGDRWKATWVLRETSKTRITFDAEFIHDNAKDAEANVKGAFFFQKKNPSQSWEAPEKTITLASLKAGEGARLPLDSAETRAFYHHLQRRYGDDTSLGLGKALEALGGASTEDLRAILLDENSGARRAFGKLLKWATELDDLEKVAEQLSGLDQASLVNLQAAVQLRTLISLRDEWYANWENQDEEFWQKQIASSPILLQLVFEAPVAIVKEKAYVGGKSVFDSRGKIVDFLLKNSLTHNVSLVEIKTPATPLLGSKYRTGVFPLSGDLMGAVAQVLTYRDSLSKEFRTLSANSGGDFDCFEPCCVVIAGHASKALLDEDRRRSFELARTQMRDVKIVSYDELYSRLEGLVLLLQQTESA